MTTNAMRWCLWLLLWAAWGIPSPSLAHKSSDAYLTLQNSAQGFALRIDVALRDVDRELELDQNADGNITWGEVRTRWGDVQALVQAGVTLQRDGVPCAAAALQAASAAPTLAQHSDGAYAVVQQRWVCAASGGDIGLQYQLFARSDATHRGLLRVVGTPGGDRTHVLDPNASHARLIGNGLLATLQLPTAPTTPAADPHSGDGFFSFVAEGVRHIGTGLDHVLFLVTLLLVVVLRREASTWVPRHHQREAWWEALRVVTAFTLAHSLTLTLAVTGLLSVPSRWVESCIALSVLLAAIDNVRPFMRAPRWVLVGVFGCVHGLGFAGPLQALGLQGMALIVPLLGFNLGVEVGQMLVVLLLLPILVAVRAMTVYRRWCVPAVSMGVAMLAAVWLVERSLDISLLP
jgi:hypothetical protein